MARSNNKEASPSGEVPAVVYVGPNMGGELLMQQFTVFRAGLPEMVQARADADPDFAALFVPVPELAEARGALSRPGSAVKSAFDAVWRGYLAAKMKGGK